MRTGDMHGVEALVRWEHPERGWIQPSEFIGVAEESGLIAELGDFVLREACMQVRRWENLALPPGFQVHVNVSPRQLRSDHLIDEIRTVLADIQLSPGRLVIEMTETFIGEHADVARERMRELKTLGVGLAIDDFGTGYSSLAILHDMPFDILKVDRAFINEVDDDARRRAFTAAIFGLGTTLGLSIVAEGVEREQQRVALLALGCSLAQGFLFSPAVPHAQITATLQARTMAGVLPLRVLRLDDEQPLVKDATARLSG
jgi:EAL domain-containing protein (putative c-di-GMP-specific phosphodiesterase class I)